MIKKAYLFPIALLSCLAFILNPSLVKAYQNTGSGAGTTLTGVGTVTFTSGAHRFTNNSLQPNTTILTCNYNCTQVYEIQAGKYFAENLANPSDAGRIFSSNDVWMRTNKELSIKMGRPVFYPLDGAPKNTTSWDVEGDPSGNNLVRGYINTINNNLGGALFRGGRSEDGGYPTTVIFSNHSALCSTNCSNESVNIPKDIVTCSPSDPPSYRLVKKAQEDGSDSVEGIYSIRMSINPIKPKNFSKLTKEQQDYWIKTHQSQTSEPILTEYGKYLKANSDTLRRLKELGQSGNIGAGSDYRTLWEKFASGAREAIAKGTPDVKLEMTSLNKEGFGRGGAFTFTELAKTASVSTTHSQDYYDEYKCTNVPKLVSYDTYETFINSQGKLEWRSVTKTKWIDDWKVRKTASNVIIDGQYTTKEVVAITSENYYPNTSYQAVNVRCNAEAFESLVSSTGSTVQTTGSGNGSATAISPTVNKKKASFYDNLSVEFFYEGNSCNQIVGCTSEQSTSTTSDSRQNVVNNGSSSDGTYGAQANGLSSSSFSFFRDNLEHEVRNDVWYVKYLNQVPEFNYDPNTALPASTLITINPDGTPAKDMFVLKDANKKELIKGTDLPGKISLVLPGEHNKFNWQASWASESDKPHGMNVRYAYKPMVKNTSVTSMGNRGPQFGEDEYVLDMYCDVNFSSTEVETPDIKNQPKPETYKPRDKFDNDPKKSLKVSFVKSSAE